MKITLIAGAVLGSLALILCVKRQQREMGILLAVAVSLVVYGASLSETRDAVRTVMEAAENSAVTEEAGTLLKALGITVITQFSADICRDAGENGLGGQLEMFGRVEIVLLALPLVARLLHLATELLA